MLAWLLRLYLSMLYLYVKNKEAVYEKNNFWSS